MSVEQILSKLQKVRGKAPRWMACCPAHDDGNPSLTIREESSGTILIHCFAGCDYREVLDAIGLTPDDLFPEPLGDRIPPVRKPFNANDVLECLSVESMIVLVYANEFLAGKQITEQDRERLVTAVSRIEAARALVNGQR